MIFNDETHFLADKLIQIHQGHKIFAVTKGSEIKTNDVTILTDPSISLCRAEEDDQKLFRHTLQCVHNRVKKVVVRTVGTDVLIFLLAYKHMGGKFDSKVSAWFGVGKNKCFYDINAVSIPLEEKPCRSLPFFHSFTGCNTVSSFF